MPTSLSRYAALPAFFVLLVFSLFFIGCPLPDPPTGGCTDCQTLDQSRCAGLRDNMIEGQWVVRYSQATESLDNLISDLQVQVLVDTSGNILEPPIILPLSDFLESYSVDLFTTEPPQAVLIGDQQELLDDLNNHFFDLPPSNQLVNGDVIPLKTCGCRMALFWINPLKVDLNNSVTQASSSTRTQDDGTPGKVTSVDINRKIAFGMGVETSTPTPVGLSCGQRLDKDDGEQAESVLVDCKNKKLNIPAVDLDTSASRITVAVIDSGLDYIHDELNGYQVGNKAQSVVWTNNKEVRPDRMNTPLFFGGWSSVMKQQPQSNCYTDDLIGYDFLHDNSDPNDRQGHGTHVGGTIATAASEDPAVRVMPLKIAGYVQENNAEVFTADLFSVLCAMEYAIEEEVAVINMSLGYYADQPNAQMKQLTDLASKKDVLIVTSVGNDSINIDCCQHWPSNLSASYSNVISVGALGALDKPLDLRLAGYSNFGRLVNIAAPGTGIWGPNVGTGNGRITKQGTSMAAAIISRQAILLRNQPSRPSAAATKQLLMNAKVGTDLDICNNGGLYYDFTKYPEIWGDIQYQP